jgi:GT2 family glycosyltransferase
MIEIVSATRLSKESFWEKSLLGRSLIRLEQDDRWVPRVAFENTRGLPEIFNARIEAESEHDILLFVHDDVWVSDFFLSDHLAEALDEFHVVGVAGNKRRIPCQPSWLFLDASLRYDHHSNLSGGIAHGEPPLGELILFGPTPADCELLDGVFLAARRSTLKEHGLRFDPRFMFHFYDLDFCRSARAMGLKLGTWPICLIHGSRGGFGRAEWRATLATYLDKWGD